MFKTISYNNLIINKISITDRNFKKVLKSFKMFEILSRCHYVLFINTEIALCKEKASSCVNLCFSNLCRPIMTKEYNEGYKFKSPIYFEDEPELNSNINIDIVEEDVKNMLKNNQESLDWALRQ